uniref:Uncharacterized protein n=1 Tax=Plectus sambesii TaxID=2011161 RepID=A0A914UMP8_9BILA
MADQKTQSAAGEEPNVSKRGIPAIDFVEDVDVFLKKEGDLTVEQAIKKLEE